MRRLLFAGTILACGAPEHAEDPHPPLAERIGFEPAVSPADVPLATLAAEVVPAPGSASWLAPPADGRLSSWAVRPGQAIEVGDPLGTLTSASLAEADGAVASLEAAVAQARGRAAAARAAADRGVASGVVAEDLAAELVLREAELRAARARTSGIRDGGDGRGDTWTWRASARGVVQEILCQPGPVHAGAPCVGLVQPGAARVVVHLPERHDVAAAPPTLGVLTLADGSTAGLTWEAQDPALDPRTRSRRLVYLADPLPPLGASGRADLRRTNPGDIVQVPVRAVTRVGVGHAVLVPADGEVPARIQPVEEVGRDSESAYVRGLTAGDLVAVRGVFLLKSLLLVGDEEGGH